MSVYKVLCLFVSLWIGGDLREIGDIHQVVIRGTPIKIEEAPFIAQYMVEYFKTVYNGTGCVKNSTTKSVNFNKVKYTSICGASIVTAKHLISAAHCAEQESSLLNQIIIAGSDYPEIYGQIIDIQTVTIHPNYCPGFYIRGSLVSLNDILVIQLVESLTFSSRVQPIPLAERDFKIPDGAMLQAMGYGETFDHDAGNELNKISIPYVEPDACERLIATHIDKETMICAGEIKFMNVAPGDSGGPLVFNSTLVGVVSAGKIGARAAIFTRVSAFRDFIDEAIKNS